MVAQPPTKAAEAEVASSPVSSSSTSAGGWSPASWRKNVARQMPKYDDPALVTEVEGILAKQAPLVFAGEVCSDSVVFVDAWFYVCGGAGRSVFRDTDTDRLLKKGCYIQAHRTAVQARHSSFDR